MMTNKPMERSARKVSEAIRAWQKPQGLGRALEARPTLDEMSERLADSKIREGGFQGFKSGEFRLSVIMPLFNCEAYVDEALESLWAQNIPMEVIIVDGGSTDATLDIVETHSSKISKILSESDRGMYDAINKGLALATGDVTKILNGDDCLAPSSAERAREYFARNGTSRCLRGRLALTNQESGAEFDVVTEANHGRWLPEFFPILHPSWYVPLEIYREHGLYLPYYRIAGDHEMLMHLYSCGVTFDNIPEVLTHFRAGGMSDGSVGVHETLETNAHYLGRTSAAGIYARILLKKWRYHLVGKALGEERAQHLWATLKSIKQSRV